MLGSAHRQARVVCPGPGTCQMLSQTLVSRPGGLFPSWLIPDAWEEALNPYPGEEGSLVGGGEW